jgi:Uma2 family endonuclease
MAQLTTQRATIEDLYHVEGKAELIGGRIVQLMGTGHKPGRVAFLIAKSLDDYAEENGGVVHADNIVYTVPMLKSERESFSPDASYYDGPLPKNPMRFIDGPPTLAIEVRSENDYGDRAEKKMAAKRADYFEAGTKVVWDVDPVAEVVHVYRITDPKNPMTYSRKQKAEAEPAVPGWKIAVEKIFK